MMKNIKTSNLMHYYLAISETDAKAYAARKLAQGDTRTVREREEYIHGRTYADIRFGHVPVYVGIGSAKIVNKREQ